MLQPQPTLAKLSNLSTDPDINSDANFLDDLQILLEKHKNTSKLSIPFMSQIWFANANFRRSVKKRTVFHKKQEKINSQTPVQEENLVQNEISTENVDNFEDLFGIEENSTNDQKPMPKVGEYWKIRFGSQSLFAYIINENPVKVHYFEQSAQGKSMVLNEKVQFDVFEDDIDVKLPTPNIAKGRTRSFYFFT